MKKLVLLLSALFLLGGCSQEFIRESSYNPTGGADYNPALDPEYNPGGGGGEEGGGSGGGGEVTPGEDDEEEPTCTYNIYFSYSHTSKYNPSTKKDEDCPIVLIENAPMLKALGSVPEAIANANGGVDKEKVLSLGAAKGFSVDPAFPNFMGFSFHGLCLDSSDLWDFAKDYKQQAVVTLYGIWYSDAI